MRYDMPNSLPAHLATGSRQHAGWLRRRSVRLLAGTTLAITGCLAFALPAHAATVHAAAAPVGAGTAAASFTSAGVSPASLSSGAADAVSPVHVQSLAVSEAVPAPRIRRESFTAVPPDVTALLKQAAPQTDDPTVASTAAALGTEPGQRLAIVGTALNYLGAPYVLGGASHSGIDCSGLSMVAYAAVGVNLAHYVPTQDAAGHRVSAADAKPGDLLVFDDEEHVAIYLGNGKLVAAPEPGRNVQIEPLSKWSGIGYHFTRVLGD
jgi:cell wall-associated NlpC family hydrolase